METATLSHDGAAVAPLAGAPATPAVSSVVQTIGSIPDNADPLSNPLASEKSDLHKAASIDAESKGNAETDDDSDDEDDDSDDDDDEDSSGEDSDDEEEDGTDSDSDSDDDEDSEDDDEDSDDDDEEDSDDDEDNQPPCKKNK